MIVGEKILFYINVLLRLVTCCCRDLLTAARKTELFRNEQYRHLVALFAACGLTGTVLICTNSTTVPQH